MAAEETEEGAGKFRGDVGYGADHHPLEEPAFDETELAYEVTNLPGWMTEEQVRQLAEQVGVVDPRKQDQWIEAHKASGLADLLNDVDPGGSATMLAIWRIFGPPAHTCDPAATSS